MKREERGEMVLLGWAGLGWVGPECTCRVGAVGWDWVGWVGLGRFRGGRRRKGMGRGQF